MNAEIPWPADKIERRELAGLIPYAKNARTHSKKQVEQIAASIQEFGFTVPLLVDENDELIAGHGRALAAASIGLPQVPVMVARGWTDEQIKAYRIADNKLALNAGWDMEMLASELLELGDMAGLVGFDEKELMRVINAGGRDVEDGLTDPDAIPALSKRAVTLKGDIWQMSDHRLMCGSILDAGDLALLLDGKRPDCCLTDPPYGIGQSVGTKKNRYKEYDDTHDNLVALVGSCMPLLLANCERIVLTPGTRNIHLYPPPTWIMAWFTPAGVGRGPWGFCCWQPILCYGADPKLKNGMGAYPDAIVHTEASPDLGHPCAKPVGFWEWMTERSTNQGELILDPFSGTGTTIITGTMKGNPVMALEITPAYVDVAVQRWQDFTGRKAILAGDGRTFQEVADARHGAQAAE